MPAAAARWTAAATASSPTSAAWPMSTSWSRGPCSAAPRPTTSPAVRWWCWAPPPAPPVRGSPAASSPLRPRAHHRKGVPPMRTIPMTLLAASLALGLAACSERQDGYDDAATPPAATEAPAAPVAPSTPAATADMTTTPAAGTMAILAATEGNSVTGEITSAAVDGGVAITGQVNGLSPNTAHGFHVHETGACSAPDGTSAGGHFNPTDSAHGRVSAVVHHVGDTDN